MHPGILIAAGGFAVGASLGFLGGGGAILTVPILLALGVEAKEAIADSLLVVAATAAVAAAGHARLGNVDTRAVALFGPATALGGFAGGRAAGLVPAPRLLLVFTALMLAAAGAMLRPLRARRVVGSPRAPASLLALAGAAIGAVAGLVGAGGGFLFVPALALLAGLPMQRAVGTSLVVIAANALAALAGHLGHVHLRVGLAGGLTAAAMAGALAGARFAGRVPEALLRRAFGVLLLGVAAWMLARSLGVA